MYTKVFEKKFPTSADATIFLDSTGWSFEGRKGIFQRYYLYTGVSMMAAGKVNERHKIRLYRDGLVKLYNDYSVRSTISVFDLPMRVWHSEDAYNNLQATIRGFNDRLYNNGWVNYYISETSPQKYSVFNIHREYLTTGKNRQRIPIKEFSSPQEAFDWVKSQPEDKPAST